VQGGGIQCHFLSTFTCGAIPNKKKQMLGSAAVGPNPIRISIILTLMSPKEKKIIVIDGRLVNIIIRVS